MLLAIDVGNTNITAGLFRGARLAARGSIPTRGSLRSLLRALKTSPGRLDGVIVSSVVPRATVVLKRSLKQLRLKPLILGENIQAPVKNRYRLPSQVGQDRLVNGVAAYFLYGGPAIVVDFGTAVTLDLISARREYLGGLIVPGIGIGLEALVSRTALLPKIGLAPPSEFLGRDTRQSMLSGLFHGYGALCDGLVAGLKSRHAPEARVIATGGHCRLMAPYCRSVQIVNPDLTLQGLRLTYETARKTP
jgi:type III pantothenate kinase